MKGRKPKQESRAAEFRRTLIISMSGSFLPSLWFSTSHSLTGSKEPALLCNHVVLPRFQN
jgi:hypothetical protein